MAGIAVTMIKLLPVLILTTVLHRQASSDANDTTCPTIITRLQWGAKPPRSGINYIKIPIPYVVILHTVTSSCESLSNCSSVAEGIQNHHMNHNNWNDIGLSFMIGGDGNVYEGTGWNREGAHTLGYNKKSVGLAFIGTFTDEGASQKMLDAAHQLIVCGKSQGILSQDVKVIGARQVVKTLSPGLALYNQIQNWAEWVQNP